MNRSAYLREIASRFGLKVSRIIIDGPVAKGKSGFGDRSIGGKRIKYKLVFHCSLIEDQVELLATALAAYLSNGTIAHDIDKAYSLGAKRTYGLGNHCSVIVWFNKSNRK